YNDAGELIMEVVWFKNFKNVIIDLFTLDKFKYAIRNSLLFYGISLLSGAGVAVFFSYYIFKKKFLGNFFKVMLYLPVIVSSMVITVMYTYFCQKGLPVICDRLFNLSIPTFGESTKVQLIYICIYNFILGCGSNVLIYTGTMAGISDSIIEAGQIDGANIIQEFFYIVMPTIFSTYILFIITGMVTIFTGQANMFNFFGTGAPDELITLGYYMYVQTQKAGTNYTLYPYLAAYGLTLTLVAIPVIFTLRWLFNKYGPSEE
ncbi:MAG: sugar ABC transporter permease, partial [Clostridia bacterium]|nr:sugar ABC transporter permease [Clostridia bacterium]